MGAVISALTFVRQDVNGTRWTDGYFVAEFRDAGGTLSGNYQPGGEQFADLANYFRNVQYIMVAPITSGVGGAFRPEPNYGDYPGNPISARIKLMGLGVSGLVVQILSGQSAFQSGAILSAQVSGQVFLRALSGVVVSEPGATVIPQEALSGTAFSGTRILIHAIGT